MKGDGVTDGGEACDDGNSSNNDGCTTACELNVCGDGFLCSQNNPNSPCNSTPGPFGKEQCDDGNLKSGDGCDANCTVTACGNGVVTSGEECDDGNVRNDDACVQGCRNAVCGDGFKRRTVEECDDGLSVVLTRRRREIERLREEIDERRLDDHGIPGVRSRPRQRRSGQRAGDHADRLSVLQSPWRTNRLWA